MRISYAVRWGLLCAVIHLVLVMSAFVLMASADFGTESVMLWGVFMFIDWPVWELFTSAVQWFGISMAHLKYDYMRENVYIPLAVFSIFGTMYCFLLGALAGALCRFLKKK